MIGIGLNVSLRSSNYILTPCTQTLLANYKGRVTLDGGSYWSSVGGEDRKVFSGRSLKPDGVMTATVPDMLIGDVLTNGGTSVLTAGNGTIAFTAGSCWDIKKNGQLTFPCVDDAPLGTNITVGNVVDKLNPMILVNPPADVWQEHIDGGGSDYLNQFGYSEYENLIIHSKDLTESIWGVNAGAVKVSALSFTLDAQNNSGIYNSTLSIAASLVGSTNTFAVKGLVGSGNILLQLVDATTFALTSSNTVVLSDTPQDCTVTRTVEAGATGIQPQFREATDTAATVTYESCILIEGTAADLPDEYPTTTTFPILGQQPAAYNSTTLDWLGNALEHPGSAKIPLQASTGPVWVGDSVAYGTSSAPPSIDVESSYIESRFMIGSSGVVLVSIGTSGHNAYLGVNSSHQIGAGIGTQGFGGIHGDTVYSPGDIVLARVEWSSTTVTLYADGVVIYSDIISGTVVLNSHIVLSAFFDFSSIHDSAIYLADIGGEHYYSLVEGTPSETALVTKDRIGTNDITWSNMSATNWQLLERPEGDYPLLQGFTKVAVGQIPSSLTDPLLDAAGNTLQYKAGETLVPDNSMTFVMPLMIAMLLADVVPGFWFDGAGVQEERTVTEIETFSLTSDQYMYKDGKYLVCSEDQTGACLEKSNKYLGRT